MYKPTHRQSIAAVLWSQGFNAGTISFMLGVSPKAVYNRIARIKKKDRGAWSRMQQIRRCHFEAKRSIKEPRLYGDIDQLSVDGTLPWWTERGDERLKIVCKF